VGFSATPRPTVIQAKKICGGMVSMPVNPAILRRHDELQRQEFMAGVERGRLAVSLDMLTDALILVGQHGVYCASSRNPSKPALDLETVLNEIGGAKELIQTVMEELARKARSATEPS
jgi:hypothetical protein